MTTCVPVRDYDMKTMSYSSKESLESDKLRQAYENAKTQKASGNDFYKRGKYKEALKCYSKAIQLMVIVDKRQNKSHNGALAILYNNRAAAYTMLNKHTQALEDANLALSADPTFEKSYFRKAKIQTELGHLNDAENTYRAALIRDPRSTKLQSELQITCHMKEELDAANKLLFSEVNKEKKPKLPPAIFNSSSPLKPEVAKQALEKIDKILQLGGCTSDASTFMLKVQALLIMQDAQEAHSICTHWLRKCPRHPSVLFWYAMTLFIGMANVEDAKTKIKYLLHHDPENIQAKTFHKLLRTLEKHKQSADSYFTSKDYTQALEKYTKILDSSICPQIAKLYRAKLFFNRALAHATLKQSKESVRDCTEAIKLEPLYVKAYMRRAATYLGSQNSTQKAIQDYEQAQQILNDKQNQEAIISWLDKGQQEIIKSEIKQKLEEARSKLNSKCYVNESNQYYQILDIQSSATDVEIRKAYRKMALRYHPDRHSDTSDKTKAQQLFRDITTVYEVLSDSSSRKRYDSGAFPSEFPVFHFDDSLIQFSQEIKPQS